MEEFELLKADILTQSMASGEGSLFEHHQSIGGSDHEDILLRTANLRHRNSVSRSKVNIEPSSYVAMDLRTRASRDPEAVEECVIIFCQVIQSHLVEVGASKHSFWESNVLDRWTGQCPALV